MIRSIFALMLAVGVAAPASAVVVRYDFAGALAQRQETTTCTTVGSCSTDEIQPEGLGYAEGWFEIDTDALANGDVYVDSSGEYRYGGSLVGLPGGAIKGAISLSGPMLPDLSFQTDGSYLYDLTYESAEPNVTSIFSQQSQTLLSETDPQTEVVTRQIVQNMLLAANIYDALIDLFGDVSLPAVGDEFDAEIAFSFQYLDFSFDQFGNQTASLTEFREGFIIPDTLVRSIVPAQVPEPAAAALIGLGLIGLGIRRRRREA